MRVNIHMHRQRMGVGQGGRLGGGELPGADSVGYRGDPAVDAGQGHATETELTTASALTVKRQ